MRAQVFSRFGTVAGVCAVALSSAGAEAPSQLLTPRDEQASFRLADERLTVELVAAEPEVVSPVAIAFDAEGRLFVAEMLDYPNARTSGRIRLLEDRDGDGRYETATVFADQLPFPNGVLPWRGGVLVTAAPDIWFLSDTNGDGRADERRVLFTGFGLGNQQLRVNGLLWGLDNWVYGANGRSEGDIRRPEGATVLLAHPMGEGSGVRVISIRGHDFRFRPDTGEFEPIAGRSQFGLARDDWGNRFLSWNTIPMRHEVLPERYLNRNPHLATTESLADILEPGDAGRVFPLAPPPLTFNDESVKNFNALAGLTIFRGGALGEAYRGNAFVGESLLNLVHRRVLEPNGVTFTARRGEREKEFLASTDPWFHPVNFATGPDGALYVVDFYRKFVEHPDWVRGAARNEVPWRTGAEHGRLWRIRNSKSQIANRKVSLSHASAPELVEHLRDDNGWWRDTAQRLLVERQERAAIPALEKLAQQAPSPLARLHALYTLDGLRALTPAVLLAALKDSQSGLREHAVSLGERWLASASAVSPPHEPEGRATLSSARRGEALPDSKRLSDSRRGEDTAALPTSSGVQSANSRSANSQPGPFPQAERPPVTRTDRSARNARAAANASPSPGGEGRGEGDRSAEVVNAILSLADDANPRVRFQVALSLGEFEAEAKLEALTRIARRDFGDRWHTLAVLSSVGPKAWPLLKKLVQEEPAWLSAPTSEQARFLDQAARLVGAGRGETELKECFTLLTQPLARPPAGHLALLAGLADGLARTPTPLRELMKHPPDAIKNQVQALGSLVGIAAARAASAREITSDRLDAIRILARVTPELSGRTLLDLLDPQPPAEVQSAAARALAELDDDGLAKTLFARWSQYAAATRRRVLSAVPRSTAMTAALADALEQGSLSPVELDASVRQSLLKTPNDSLKRRFQKLLTTATTPDRQEVVARFQPALKMEGDRPRGAALFAKTCLLCHTVEGQGRHVGPDLSGIASRPKEALLVDILDPSRQVSPDFINYTLVTTDGNLVTGFIASETAASVTLRRAGDADDTVLRTQIKELRAEGKSLMPEGLEQGLTPQEMADLLSFLQKPEGRLLPAAP